MREIIRLERSTATTTGAILLARKTSPLTKQVRYTAAVFIAGRIDRGPMPSRHQVGQRRRRRPCRCYYGDSVC